MPQLSPCLSRTKRYRRSLQKSQLLMVLLFSAMSRRLSTLSVRAFGVTRTRIRNGVYTTYTERWFGRDSIPSRGIATSPSGSSSMKPTSPPGDDTGENSNRVEILDKKTKAEIELLTRTWRDHPSFNRTIMFRSWQLQDGAAIQSLVTNKITQQYLLSLIHI